ncbi:MAG TPA: methionine gamma-lyase family protein [Firmicutes bacterium]|nr:methionine gamma-lyase family protein [Bacillota bacterium]
MSDINLMELTKKAEHDLADIFADIDDIAYQNTERVIDSFRTHRVDDTCFAGTSGYGHDDRGRETLDAIYADVFGAESAFVRHTIANGTMAITIGLYGLLRPHDIMLAITGKPYDTLEEVVGISGQPGNGSLADFGVGYRQVDLLSDGSIDFDKADEIIKAEASRVKVVFIQRSKGYLDRPTLTVEKIGEIVKFVKSRCGAYVVVDNCYGEFTETREPTAVGADLIMGSLIKNPGGGMAESGGYIAGTARAVELASYRMTSVGVGLDGGATLGMNKSLIKGFFYAPHTVAQALKTAHLAAYIFEALGCDVSPRWNERRADIIQTIRLGDPKKLVDFCKGIQAASPVDSYVSPEPSPIPGYADEVIMAAGTFTQGASIELSCDGPMRAPYIAYMQGGLTYESGKLGVLGAAKRLLGNND